MSRHPAEPYLDLARRLADVAGLQLSRLQFDEAAGNDNLRSAAMDCFAREVVEHLNVGWAHGPRSDSRAASVYAHWISAIERVRPEARPIAMAVWKALKDQPPPAGWLPTGPEDPIIVKAFALGWPIDPKNPN
jgi:hypothetical protein